MSGVIAYIALGSNLQDPAAQVEAAFTALDALPDSTLRARSSLYRTTPVGYADQADFINAVAAIETKLAPRALLDALLTLEQARGRARTFQNAPRTLDLDVLLYADQIIDQPGLAIPHPRLHERAFVLVPLSEIAPDLVIPGRGRVSALLRTVDARGVQREGAAAVNAS